LKGINNKFGQLQRRDTIECLESLIRLDGHNFKIIVSDNASSDDSPRRKSAWAEGVAVRALNADVDKFRVPPISKPIGYLDPKRAVVMLMSLFEGLRNHDRTVEAI
jgi:hypothetical protein